LVEGITQVLKSYGERAEVTEHQPVASAKSFEILAEASLGNATPLELYSRVSDSALTASLAEQERKMISERIEAALALTRVGRARFTLLL
jgi:hypothetical protein